MKLFIGDVRERIKEIPDGSVDCVVTSPPYWGLRDYGADGQIGLEPDWRDWLGAMEEVFGEVMRVLKPSGTCWVNLGDKYASDSKWGGATGGKHVEALHGNSSIGRIKSESGIPDKNLCLLPQRFAIAMQDMGWYVRSEIIWHKPSPMPESVKDRPTRGHETIWLLTKSERYFYDNQAVTTPIAESTVIRYGQNIDCQRGSDRAVLKGAPMKAKFPSGWDNLEVGHGAVHRNGRAPKSHKGSMFNRGKTAVSQAGTSEKPREESLAGANLRTVWTIASTGYTGAHFATFPEEIPKRCILLGCPPIGVVLDPFAGSGTTLAVAISLGRHAVGIELNPEYAELIRQRIEGVTIGMVLS